MPSDQKVQRRVRWLPGRRAAEPRPSLKTLRLLGTLIERTRSHESGVGPGGSRARHVSLTD